MADHDRSSNSITDILAGGDDDADIFGTLFGGAPREEEPEEVPVEEEPQLAEGEIPPGWDVRGPDGELPTVSFASSPQRAAAPPQVQPHPAHQQPAPPQAASPQIHSPQAPPVYANPGYAQQGHADSATHVVQPPPAGATVQGVALTAPPPAQMLKAAQRPQRMPPPQPPAVSPPREPLPDLPEGGGALLREFVNLRHRVASLGTEVETAAERAHRAMEEALRLQAEYEQVYQLHGETYERHAEATRRLDEIELTSPEDAALGVAAAMEMIEDLSTGSEESPEIATRMRKVLKEALKVMHGGQAVAAQLQAGGQPQPAPQPQSVKADPGTPVRLAAAPRAVR
jgi:hypothetical protein